MLKENIAYVENIKRFGIRMGLENITKLMETLGNPHKKFRSVHIGGTNGKGSTSTIIASILKEAGYRTGLYLSPYVEKFNERVQINGEMISDEELDELITELRKIVEKMEIDITFFEFVTALGFMYFARKKVDIVVVEVGLGGRLDATNVVKSEISVITNIGLDHQEWLGKTKKEIAREKAGIIKENQICVTAEEDPALRSYFESVCKEKNSRLIYINDMMKADLIESNLDFQRFSAFGIAEDNFKIRLLGEHQIRNAMTAIVVAEKLGLNTNSIKRGLEKAFIPGRLQVISKKPLIIFDGAHNLDGLVALRKFIFPIRNKKVLVLGISNDRPIAKMAKLIAPLFEKVIVTEGRFKPTPAEKLAKAVKKFNKNVDVAKDASAALKMAIENVKEDEMILVAGSLYLISDALNAIEKEMPNNLDRTIWL